ncbi:MAG: molecular chaperone DnaK [Candidatus Lloydbacteria bacterium CG22_combo_CG10-13_8_21_14_all_47_15]|uniref:Chaperone protein DnaK n=1 Tax=Candidatus Lloydbacteria bacterium CG22_combo_CG10-13_8_21_14_all_47_15 TaxID=1974635 RepID=A0A2H0CVK2_9BACT|nr:MAG: molecular chaperone DnaK [Candidatus Lloydbacteria bacterium CG22_combo_CG10-13_8_21_14_all_47_15]
MSKILGIDLGTTNSAMAIVEGGEPKIIENTEGNRTTPSVVALSKGGERIVGLLAKRQAVTNPENTMYGVKRLIGHRFEDAEVQKDKASVPFTIEKGDGAGVKVKMGDAWFRPEEVSAMVLGKLKHDAEERLGEKITEAIITVPAYFNDAQRKATKDAGKIAGLEVKRIINEPTAAALAYGLNKKKNEQIAVYDFGGGTFDVSVLEVGEDVIEVKSTDGDSHMGGEDIDREMVAWIGNEFKKENGVDILKDTLALQRLKEAAEKAKHELSTTTETEINIPFITSGAEGPKHLLIKMSRATLENIARPFIEKSIEITKRAVKNSPFDYKDIDEIILVGGQTRMPAIVSAVKELFGKEPNRSINPDEVVALGAAVQAGILQGDVKDVLLLDVIPLSLGIETMGNVATKLIEKNTTIPVSKSQVFSTAADNQTSVEIHVTQGERPMAADNKSLGRFILDGIPPSSRGLPQIEVSFDVDVNGILSVTAKDKATGKVQSIKIEASSGLSDEDIEKMKKDAEMHADEDRQKKELVDARNLAEQLSYTAEKALNDAEGKIPDEIKNLVQGKIDALKQVKDGDDLAVLKKATEELSTEMQKIGEHMAKAGQGQAGGEAAQNNADNASGSSSGGTEGNIRDAEVEDDNKGDADSKENGEVNQ